MYMRALTYKQFQKIALGFASFVLIVGGAIILWPDHTGATANSCEIGHCPKEIRMIDNGGIFSYKLGSRFNIVLDKQKYPAKQVGCIGGEGLLEEKLVLADLFTRIMQKGLRQRMLGGA